MAQSLVFDWTSAELERHTSLSRLEARGTVRLVLKTAGLEPGAVTVAQMLVVLARLMAPALSARRVVDAPELCEHLMEDLQLAAEGGLLTSGESAYDVFERLGSRSLPKGRKP